MPQRSQGFSLSAMHRSRPGPPRPRSLPAPQVRTSLPPPPSRVATQPTSTEPSRDRVEMMSVPGPRSMVLLSTLSVTADRTSMTSWPSVPRISSDPRPGSEARLRGRAPGPGSGATRKSSNDLNDASRRPLRVRVCAARATPRVSPEADMIRVSRSSPPPSKALSGPFGSDQVTASSPSPVRTASWFASPGPPDVTDVTLSEPAPVSTTSTLDWRAATVTHTRSRPQRWRSPSESGGSRREGVLCATSYGAKELLGAGLPT